MRARLNQQENQVSDDAHAAGGAQAPGGAQSAGEAPAPEEDGGKRYGKGIRAFWTKYGPTASFMIAAIVGAVLGALINRAWPTQEPSFTCPGLLLSNGTILNRVFSGENISFSTNSFHTNITQYTITFQDPLPRNHTWPSCPPFPACPACPSFPGCPGCPSCPSCPSSPPCPLTISIKVVCPDIHCPIITPPKFVRPPVNRPDAVPPPLPVRTPSAQTPPPPPLSVRPTAGSMSMNRGQGE